MLSKFLKPSLCLRTGPLLLNRIRLIPQINLVRRSGEILPPSQYDIPIPKKLQLSYTLRVYWEIIPLFAVTMLALTLMVISIIWACLNKVDVVFSTHSRQNISRTMDLRNPTVHKMLLIKQRYEPWPEMQDVLDKMVTAERRSLMRMQTCAHA